MRRYCDYSLNHGVNELQQVFNVALPLFKPPRVAFFSPTEFTTPKTQISGNKKADIVGFFGSSFSWIRDLGVWTFVAA